MKIAALSCCSVSGIWTLAHSSSTTAFTTTWEDNQSTGLQQSIEPKLDESLKLAGWKSTDLEAIFVVRGPGAFTGLRLSASYALGLGTALGIPVYEIPSFQLNPEEKPFFISLRPQITKTLSLEECLKSGYEFLEIQSSSKHEIKIPTEKDTVWGIKDFPNWPSQEQMMFALKKALAQPIPLKEIVYGMEPKIFGKR